MTAALDQHRREIGERSLRELFAADPKRFERLSLSLDGLFLDLSKQRITPETIDLLCAFARDRGLPEAIRRLFAGERVNATEGRAALHMALRNPADRPMPLDGKDVMPEVAAARAAVGAFAEAIRGGRRLGSEGRRISDVVAIGIGGSHLGPRLAVEALAPHADGPKIHFLSNIDGGPVHDLLGRLDPAATLFVVASKTFGTLETMANARAARRWLVERLGEDEAIGRHVVAVTANAKAAMVFGISDKNIFAFADWVGGRTSLWSAIGLPIAAAIGRERFEAMLAGAHSVDAHFRATPLERNLPALLALVGLWEIDWWGSSALAIVPYDDRLRRLPSYVRQLDMESNGKRVGVDGRPVERGTAPVVFGEAGTDGQHAFFQALHQGTRVIPVEFIACRQPDHPLADHHRGLLANCLAQSEALMRGRTEAETRAALATEGRDAAGIERLTPHLAFPGGRPSTTILLDRLDPRTFGALIALYEHKVFVQAAIWGINPFDQWGVELGKRLAEPIERELAGGPVQPHDPSTAGLIARLKGKD
ncbi:MAG: glucose-6-phosphate isomerase [Alphaproteobacteria bacterium]|nr:glucose-6-phosphate isomerase [Alphaproteobacteria bacterium]